MKRWTRVVSVSVFAIAVAACGGGETPPPAPEPEAVVEAPASEEVATEVAEAAPEVTEDPAAEVTEDPAGAADMADMEAATEDPAEVVEAVATEDAAEEATEEGSTDTAAAPAEAGEPKVIDVEMLNVHPEDPRLRMVFYPRVVQANVGDTIRFVPVDMTHQAASIEGLIPEGAEGFNSRINDEYSYTVTEPGLYAYQCVPHLAAGMVGLIVVEGEGKLDNREAVESATLPGLSGRYWPDIIQEAVDAGYIPAG